MDRINLLWLDDDLRPRSEGASIERERLQTWLRYLHTTDRNERIRVIEVRDLVSFRQQLELRCNKPVDDPEHIDAFLIDVLWRESSRTSKWTFGELDPVFGDERVLPMDAGAQLIGLMRNGRHRAKRPAWLSAFDNHPIAVLTTLIDPSGTVDHHLDEDVLKLIKILVKDSSSETEDPDQAFCDWVGSLTRRCAAASNSMKARSS